MRWRETRRRERGMEGEKEGVREGGMEGERKGERVYRTGGRQE